MPYLNGSNETCYIHVPLLSLIIIKLYILTHVNCLAWRACAKCSYDIFIIIPGHWLLRQYTYSKLLHQANILVIIVNLFM